MQSIFLPKSALNTVICDGIADLLKIDYPNIERPTVIRSVPNFSKQPLRPCGQRIKVIYHGIIYKTRGLEMAIESLPLWSDEFEFIIRGPGAMEYIRFLRLRAKALGVGHRLTVEDPVNFDQIIPEANKADIGYFVQPDISLQKRYTLPNKFFEYIMSGLALCVSNLPEMSKIVRRYDLGVLVDGYSKESIAMSINSLTRESILQYKKNALDAAHDFCWDKESRTMMRAYNQITNKNEF
jgi:glycosyltransferase involved in cell wall biosynthesis